VSRTKRLLRRIGAGAIAAVVALAQSAPGARAAAPPEDAKDWEVELSAYGWLSLLHGSVDTDRFGSESFTVTAKDVLESLDLAAFASASARWRRFVFFTDFAWARLSDDGGVGDTLVRYDLTQKLGWFEALAGYRVYRRPGGLFGTPAPDDTRSFDVDLMAGLTYGWVDVELDLKRDALGQVPPQERSLAKDHDAVAPYLAARFRNDFTARFAHELLLGIGGFGVGDAPHAAWQVTSLFSYALSEHWRLRGGYRALGQRYPDLHTTFHGPILGVALHF
jgi:hypothetical protein